MNYIDIIILVFIVLAAFKGFSKGLVIGIASLAGLVLGIIFSLRYAGLLAENLQPMFGSNSKFISIAAYVICFVLVVLFVHIIGKSVEKVIEIAALGLVNRLAGALFGVAKVILVFSAFFFLLKIADPGSQMIRPETMQKSFFYKRLEGLLPSLLPFLKTQLENLDDAIEGQDAVQKTP
ncbi:MAG: CvpA family protein [Bacteroidota bacterium]